jgi:predicted Zn-dependent protease
LDAPQLGELTSIKNGPRIVRSIVLHEIGHLAGLSHVSDSNQLMFPHAQDKVLEYQAGDLAGLALLGQGQCSRAF